MPPPGTDLKPDTPIDISHEALIRRWVKLAGDLARDEPGWLLEEQRDGRLYAGLVQETEAEDVLSPGRTRQVLEWWDPGRRNAAWAERHGGKFDAVQKLIHHSSARHKRQRLLRVLGVGSAAAVAFLLAALSILSLTLQHESELRREAEAARREALAARDREQEIRVALQDEIEERREAERQTAEARQETALERSRVLAGQAQEQIEAGSARTGLLLALEPLRDTLAYPYVPQAEQAAYHALTREAWMVLRGHENAVAAVAFSPDGARMVSGSTDATIRIWGAAGRELNVLRGHQDWVRDVAFLPDGQSILSASDDGTVRLWDARTGAERLVLRGHEGWIMAAAASPDGRRIFSGGDGGTVRVWDAADGKTLETLQGHTGGIDALDVSSDGMRVASASYDGTALGCRGGRGAPGAERRQRPMGSPVLFCWRSPCERVPIRHAPDLGSGQWQRAPGHKRPHRRGRRSRRVSRWPSPRQRIL